MPREKHGTEDGIEPPSRFAHSVMPYDRVKILLVDADAADARRIADALSRSGSPSVRYEVTHETSLDNTFNHLGEGLCDIVVCVLGEAGDHWPTTVERLAGRVAGCPLIAVADGADGLAAVEHGAVDYVERRDVGTLLMDKAIRCALVRARGHGPWIADADRARELDRLRSLCGPSPVAVTERRLGAGPMRLKATSEFSAFVARYAELLERAVTRRTVRTDDHLEDDLTRLADRLGLLGAGPRDAVDLHRAAVAAKLDGQPAAKARALIEESRLLLLQLMGYLVSYYRSLSWGAGPRPPRLRPAIPKPDAAPTNARRR